jgi:hypothetical protein
LYFEKSGSIKLSLKHSQAVELLQQPKLIKDRVSVTNAKCFLALGNAFGIHKIGYFLKKELFYGLNAA